MPDDAIFAADSAEHRGAHLARERALWLPKAILRAVRDRRALERGSNRLEICERRQERDIGFGYERRGAAGRYMRHLIGEAELVRCSRRIAAADDGDSARIDDRLTDRFGSRGE